ncbi:unnamed protein product, partial [Phaeothamnion confervicola]
GDARLVVVDVESSGLDVRHDRLISIGALAVSHGTIQFAQSFETILRQDAPSTTENILVHRIGGTRQCEGDEPSTALLSFLDFAGKDPLVAFHAEFDRILLGRALEQTLGTGLRQPWLDLAELAPALLGERAPNAKNLDDWLAACGIGVYARHDALADTLATAQLLLIVLGACAGQGVSTLAGLRAIGRNRRWLQPR